MLIAEVGDVIEFLEIRSNVLSGVSISNEISMGLIPRMVVVLLLWLMFV